MPKLRTLLLSIYHHYLPVLFPLQGNKNKMEFEEQDDHDEEMDMATSYDSLQGGGNNNNNSGGGASQLGRAKMAGSSGGGGGEVGATAQSQPRSASNNSRPRYRECLKNHAVGLGGHALDGCGEFLAAGADGTIDALKCAACSCHRNFHRKETDHSASTAAAAAGLRLTPEPYSLVPAPHHHYPQFSQYYRTPAGYLQVRPLALPSTSGGGGAGEDQEDVSDVPNMGGGGGMQMMQYGSTTTSSSGKKRFRTKFTQEQRERMLGLAERLGWRIQKQDDALVQEFCSDTGVRRHVLKVWMHNNKHTLGKKP